MNSWVLRYCCLLAIALGCQSLPVGPPARRQACPEFPGEEFRELSAVAVLAVAHRCERAGRIDLAVRAYLSVGRAREAGRLIASAPRLEIAQQSVELQGRSGSLPLVEVRLGRRVGWMIWDTGAAASAFDSAFLRDSGIDTLPGVSKKIGTGAGRQAEVAYLRDLRIGPFAVASLFAISADLGALRAVDERIVGVVGEDLWGAFPFELQLAARKLRVGAAVAMPAPQDRLHAAVQAAHFMVASRVDGVDVDFLLDTGATRSAISESAFRKLDAPSARVGSLRATRVDASGEWPLDVQTIAVERLEIGETEQADVSLLVDDHSRLGVDVLSAGTLVVDPAQRAVYWTR